MTATPPQIAPFTLDPNEKILRRAEWNPVPAYIGAGVLAFFGGLSIVLGAGFTWGALIGLLILALVVAAIASGPKRKLIYLTSSRVAFFNSASKSAHFLPLEKIDSVRTVGSSVIKISSGKFGNQMNLNLLDAAEFAWALEQARSNRSVPPPLPVAT